MQQDIPTRATRRQVDETALARAERRLARGGQAPWLHVEVARRMAQRLACLRQPPATVLDWFPGSGGSAPELEQALPTSQLRSREPAAAQPPTRRFWPWFGGRSRTLPVSERQALEQPVDLLWANMGLHRLADPGLQFRYWSRFVRVGGLLLFSTLGPGTLAGLRDIYREAGWGPPLADLPDMHDLGDMLLHAGFEDPVMDQETLTLTWSHPGECWKELAAWGSNAHPQRWAGLRTPRWREQWNRAMTAAAAQQGVGAALAVEVVYGHAVRSALGRAVDGEVSIGLAEMRQQMAARKGARS